jgi:putative cell wall-binding protein
MVKKMAQRAIVAGLSGLMTISAVVPAAMAAPAGNYWLDEGFVVGEPVSGTRYWKRISGADRYGTMEAIVKAFAQYKAWFANNDDVKGYAHFNIAVIASGENYPDALAANGLAGSLQAPVILTKKDALSSQAKSLLSNLTVQTVFIMGGTNSVSQKVEDEIKNLHIATVRVAGNDRQATSLAAYKLIDGNWYKNSGARDLIVATGASYADALSIAPYAYRIGAPIILTQADGTLTDEALDEIAKNKYIERVVIVGGKDSVKASVIDAIDKYDKYGRRNFEFVRLGGDNRYATSALIAEWEIEEWYGNAAFGDFTFDTCYVADGENYPDALAGGQLAGGFWNDTYMPAPLLLTKDGDTTAERFIDKEIDDWGDTLGIFNWCVNEPDYNWYLDNKIWKDTDYMFADAWYGTKNDYLIDASFLYGFANENQDFFDGSVLTIDPITINGADETVNGDEVDYLPIYRNLGILNDGDNFFGYILGGENSVSKKKAESLDQVVKDNLDIDDVIVDSPVDDTIWGPTVAITTNEMKKFSSLDAWADQIADALAETPSETVYFKLEYDRSVNGVDRWIVKAPYKNKWTRINGIYAYAYNYQVNGANGPLKATDWLIMGETYSESELINALQWTKNVFNNNWS